MRRRENLLGETVGCCGKSVVLSIETSWVKQWGTGKSVVLSIETSWVRIPTTLFRILGKLVYLTLLRSLSGCF